MAWAEPQELHEPENVAPEYHEPLEVDEAQEADEPEDADELQVDEPQEELQEVQEELQEELQDEPETARADDASVAVPNGKRSRDQGDKEKIAKRPRWGNKTFEEITIGDVETLVRKCNSLEKKVEENAEAVAQLRELQKEKKDLEKELAAVQSDDIVAHVKASIAKQFSTQMNFVFAWNDELKSTGRPISAFVPNVSPQLLKALGGTVERPKDKLSVWYFPAVPTRSVPPTGKKNEKPGGTALVLGSNITLKYIKTTSELQVLATYKFGVPEKTKLKSGKRKGRGKGRAGGAAGEEEDVDGEDGEEGEEEADDDEEVSPSDQGIIAVGGQ